MGKGYELLTEFISTRMLDDFTGYNKATQSFDIVQAVKEIIEYQEERLEKYDSKGINDII